MRHRTRSTVTLRHWRQSTRPKQLQRPLWLLWALLAVISLAWATHGQDAGNNAYERQRAAIRIFDVSGTAAQQTAQRQQLAQTLLQLSRDHLAIEPLRDDVVREQVTNTAATGAPLDLHPRPYDTWHHMRNTAFAMIGTMLLAQTLLFGGLQLDFARRERRYRFDLPWRNGWPWLLLFLAPWLLVTFVPQIKPWLLERRTQRAAADKEKVVTTTH